MKYIIAIYLRLSVDDKRIESMSIESQRLLLRKYAEKLADDVEIIEYLITDTRELILSVPAYNSFYVILKHIK